LPTGRSLSGVPSKATVVMTKIELVGLLDGGRYFEGPRWHAGRLWFVDCMNRTLLSLDCSGGCEQHARFEDDTPCGLGILPDGRLVVLTMFRKRLMICADGQLSLSGYP
jgi:sugar lactone lactonase YvrE